MPLFEAEDARICPDGINGFMTNQIRFVLSNPLSNSVCSSLFLPAYIRKAG